MFVCSLFFKQEMELSLIGLQNAGKTSLVNVIAVSSVALPPLRLETVFLGNLQVGLLGFESISGCFSLLHCDVHVIQYEITHVKLFDKPFNFDTIWASHLFPS